MKGRMEGRKREKQKETNTQTWRKTEKIKWNKRKNTIIYTQIDIDYMDKIKIEFYVQELAKSTKFVNLSK